MLVALPASGSWSQLTMPSARQPSSWVARVTISWQARVPSPSSSSNKSGASAILRRCPAAANAHRPQRRGTGILSPPPPPPSPPPPPPTPSSLRPHCSRMTRTSPHTASPMAGARNEPLSRTILALEPGLYFLRADGRTDGRATGQRNPMPGSTSLSTVTFSSGFQR
jgi:hypothetical protein